MTTPSRRDEFHRLRTGYLRLRSALRDPVTGLFAYPIYIDEVRALLADRNRIGVLWVSLGARRLVETVYGWEAYDQLVASSAAFLSTLPGELLHAQSIVATSGVHADTFVLFVPAEHGGRELDGGMLANLAAALEDRLEDKLARTPVGSSPAPGGVRVGGALLTDNPFHRFERRIYLALDEARAHSDQPRDAQEIAWLGEIQRVLRERDVQPVFQPVVDLLSGATVALEAYARGPVGSVFRLPRVMFSVSQEAGFGVELDRMCHRLALEALAGTEPPPLLFLNTTVENLLDPEWSSREMLEAQRLAGLDPSRIVLEVPENQLVADPDAYREALVPLRALGYMLSLDDVGSGPRSVTLIEKLRPEFMKFDLTLVRGIDRDQLRRELVRSLVALAQRAGARLVVERVETRLERETLLECGAEWGQGYLFAVESPRGAVSGAAGREGLPS